MSIPRVAPESGAGCQQLNSTGIGASAVARAARCDTFFLFSLAILLSFPPGADAQPAQPTPGPAPPKVLASDFHLIATVRANGVERGEFSLLRKAGGDYWIGAQDLPRLKLEPLEQARREDAGESYFSFEALGADAISFDENQLTLSVSFAAKNLERTRIDLSTRPAPFEPSLRQTSLILSYRLSTRSTGQGDPTQTTLENSLNVRVAGLLLRQETKLEMASNQRRFTRGRSQVIRDDRESGTRLIAGDVLSSAGSFGSTLTGAGLLLTRLYDLTPDVIKQPTVTLQASTGLPADVEIAIDGNPIFRTRVGPGPITISNLLLNGGGRNVRMTVTDSAGRREVIEQSFMFSDSVLAKGLHEYSYFAGRRSVTGSKNDLHYAEAAWQGFHRYGLTDHLTVAGGGEGSREFVNAGVGATLSHDVLGLFSLDALSSVDRGKANRALGWSARYTYPGPIASVILARRQFGTGFRTFSTTPDSPFLQRETRVVAGARLFSGTLAADFAQSISALESRSTRVLRYTTAIGSRSSLSVEYESNRINDKPGWAANLFLRFDLGSQRWAGTTMKATSSSRTLSVETGKQLDQGEGVGYRLGVSSSLQPGGEAPFGYLSANWHLRPATLEFYGTSQLRGKGGKYAEVGMSGALVGIDGEWGLTRAVEDSFVLARLGVPQEGVEISVNNQVQGRTDKKGQLLIPQIGAFGRQDVSVSDKQIGMQYNIRERRKTITPDYRSGTTVNFGGTKISAVAGMAWQVQDARRTPISSRAWTLSGNGRTLIIETGSAGDFYLEDAPPGSYAGTLEILGKAYSCRMTVPDFSEAVHELKQGILCD